MNISGSMKWFFTKYCRSFGKKRRLSTKKHHPNFWSEIVENGDSNYALNWGWCPLPFALFFKESMESSPRTWQRIWVSLAFWGCTLTHLAKVDPMDRSTFAPHVPPWPSLTRELFLRLLCVCVESLFLPRKIGGGGWRASEKYAEACDWCLKHW